MWWLNAPYWYPYAYWWSRFPWLPRWWTGIYGATYEFPQAYTGLPKEQEIRFLEDQKRVIEETLSRINRRLEELKKEQPASAESIEE